jgi:hypothetical protein
MSETGANVEAWQAIFAELSEAASAKDCPQREAWERAAWVFLRRAAEHWDEPEQSNRDVAQFLDALAGVRV